MKLYKFLLCACLALPVMSCDDYLDIQPKGIVIPEKSEDYERLLNYAQLLKASESYPNFMTDDVFMPYEDDMTGGFVSLELPKQHLYAFNSEIFGEGESDGLWEYSYNRIYYYNVVIDDIMGATQDTEEHKKQLRAEALVGRAFEYLTLVNAYANHYDPSTAATDPGVPLMLDKNINKTNLQRATVQEVYDQIKADLDEAAPNLPEKPVLNAYRASKPVGYGMLARMYLYMGDYKKALENAVISLQNNSTLMSLFPYKVVDRDKYIGRIDVPDGDENPENIYIRLAPWTFGFSATAYASEELASLYDQEKDQRYLLYFTKYLGGIDLDYPLWAPYIYANRADRTRAVRAREGLIHVGHPDAEGKVRAGRRRHAVFGRDRRYESGRSGQGAAGFAGEPDQPCGQRQGHRGGRARRGGHEPESRADGQGRAVPQGPVLSAERVSRLDASTAGTAGGHSSARRELP